jgi:hypothetical protein
MSLGPRVAGLSPDTQQTFLKRPRGVDSATAEAFPPEFNRTEAGAHSRSTQSEYQPDTNPWPSGPLIHGG